MDLYQVYSNYATGAKNAPPPPHPHIKSTFSEYGHVAYQIKEDKAYNNMLANILLLHLPLTPEVGSKGSFVIFLKVVMLHNEID